ncbi:hypothetical protein Tco_1478925 [Tanacetum coccineum]
MSYPVFSLLARCDSINAWQKVIDRFKMKLTRWRESSNSNQATISVVKAVLMRGSSIKKKLHLVAWNIVCKPKELGGLGVVPLRLKNIALLASWWAKFNANKSSLWKLVIKKKYSRIFPSKLIELHSIPLHSRASTVWKNIVNIQSENNILQGDNGPFTVAAATRILISLPDDCPPF